MLNGLAAVAESRQQWASAETMLCQLIKLDAKNAAANNDWAACSSSKPRRATTSGRIL